MLTISCEVALEIWFRSQYVCASYFSNGCDGFHLHELRFLAGDILGLFCRPWVHTCMSVTCRFKRAQKNLYEFMSLWNLRLKCSQYVNEPIWVANTSISAVKSTVRTDALDQFLRSLQLPNSWGKAFHMPLRASSLILHMRLEMLWIYESFSTTLASVSSKDSPTKQMHLICFSTLIILETLQDAMPSPTDPSTKTIPSLYLSCW